jgi:hypothetical protein
MCGQAAAQFDHLHCMKVAADERVVGDVDLASALPELPAQAGCRIKGPKLFCGPVAKTIIRVEPPAAGAPPGPEATSYLCYKARCDRVPGSFQATDQFATYTLRPRKSFLLCTPARVGTTTSTTASPTTTTSPQACGLTAPTCNGACTIGELCVFMSFGLGGSGCGCVAPPVCADGAGGLCGGNCPPACLCTSILLDACTCVCG